MYSVNDCTVSVASIADSLSENGHGQSDSELMAITLEHKHGSLHVLRPYQKFV
jgi:hypothetical protein